MKPLFKPLYTLIELLIVVAVIGVMLGLAPIAPISPAAHAATSNVAAGYNVVLVPLHLSKQYTASVTAEARFKMPFACEVLGVGASARASGGTSPTLTVDVKEAGTTILSSAITVTAGSYTEGTVSDTSIADEAEVTVDLTIGGTSPTWDGVTVLITCVRK